MTLPLAQFEREVMDEMALIHAQQSPHWSSWTEEQQRHYVGLMRGNVVMHAQVRDVLRAVMRAEERLGLRRKQP